MHSGFSVTVHGAGHIARGQLCEDFSCYASAEDCQVFAVADGHGDPNCCRSAAGSRLISEIACRQLSEFSRLLHTEKREDRLFQSKSDSVIYQLVASIVSEWYGQVETDFQDHPLTEEERCACSEKWLERYDRGERIAHIYGTTLIAGLLTPRYLLLLQQGDGHCFLFDEQGGVSQPIPWDERCFDNITTSLCDEDALSGFRHYVIDLSKQSFMACLLCTDGVEDSFPSMDQLYCYLRRILADAVTQPDISNHLKWILPQLSQNGSRDDISIAGVFAPEMVRCCLPRFDYENRVAEARKVHLGIQRRLRSIETSRKLEILERKMIKLPQDDPAYEKCCAQYNASLALYRHLQKAEGWAAENVRRLENREEPLPEPDWEAGERTKAERQESASQPDEEVSTQQPAPEQGTPSSPDNEVAGK